MGEVEFGVMLVGETAIMAVVTVEVVAVVVDAAVVGITGGVTLEIAAVAEVCGTVVMVGVVVVATMVLVKGTVEVVIVAIEGTAVVVVVLL